MIERSDLFLDYGHQGQGLTRFNNGPVQHAPPTALSCFSIKLL
jgi:hypothetical protein